MLLTILWICVVCLKTKAEFHIIFKITYDYAVCTVLEWCFMTFWDNIHKLRYEHLLHVDIHKKRYHTSNLKLVSAIFYFLTKWYLFKNYEKCFLFHLKALFRSRDIQFFVLRSTPIFLPVGHYFRGWLKINLKVYDIINCLKKWITHFVWYLEKEKRYDIDTLSIGSIK